MDKILLQNSQNKNQVSQSSINKNNFNFMYVIGKGGFGKVWKVNPEPPIHSKHALCISR